MKKFKELPDSEFEIMKVVWNNHPPITTSIVMEELGNNKGWKIPTVISLMSRLIERNFLKTEKKGKERLYYPLVSKDEYLQFETSNFIKQYHNSSFVSLVNTLYDGEQLNNDEIEALLKWAEERSR